MKRCLIVVDYQVDFVSGTLGFPEAGTLAAPIAQKIQQYHAAKDAVLFTLDTHGTDYAPHRKDETYRLYTASMEQLGMPYMVVSHRNVCRRMFASKRARSAPIGYLHTCSSKPTPM